MILAVLAGCHPGDNLRSDAAPDAAPDAEIDAPRGVPDLQFLADEMIDTIKIDQHVFTEVDCEVQEACVGAIGNRRLLRFDTRTANLGTANLHIGKPPPNGMSNDLFQWSPCHMHHHYANYVSYELVSATGSVISARKQAFCLEDDEQVLAGTFHNYTCLDQGISIGWADVYDNMLACQWIDITGVPSGTYTLRIVLNPQHQLVESNYDNNLFTLDVQL
jgi:Lysyl oxidase